MKKALLILLSTLMLFAFASCDGRYIPTPKDGYTKIDGTYDIDDIQKIISEDKATGIWSEQNVIIKTNKEITVNRDFGFLNVTFVSDTPDTQTAIVIEGTDNTVDFDHVMFKNYKQAITINGTQNKVEIIDSTFQNCTNGFVASTGLESLSMSGTTMKGIGLDSGINIDQTVEGGEISISNSNFTNFDKESAGAIKISCAENGSLNSVIINGNTFSQNRKDVVIGTTYPTKLAESTTIQNCELEDNSGNGYKIVDGKLIVDKGTTTT